VSLAISPIALARSGFQHIIRDDITRLLRVEKYFARGDRSPGTISVIAEVFDGQDEAPRVIVTFDSKRRPFDRKMPSYCRRAAAHEDWDE
jgi:hypothetical protein